MSGIYTISIPVVSDALQQICWSGSLSVFFCAYTFFKKMVDFRTLLIIEMIISHLVLASQILQMLIILNTFRYYVLEVEI